MTHSYHSYIPVRTPKTGSRRIISYLLSQLLEYKQEILKER